MSCCNPTDTIQVCFVPADATVAPATLLLHTKEGTDGSGDPTTVSYLSTADDQNAALDPAAYLGGGAFTPGACPIALPDVEWIELCEKLADGSNQKFVRRSVTTFDALNTPTSAVDDFELDKVTPYVVADEDNVGDCGCEPLVNTGLVTDTADFN